MQRVPNSADWWTLPPGKTNTICDVPDVKVGHFTNLNCTARTGVSAILPHSGNLFDDPVQTGVAVLNGFGKSLGIVQVQELGEIETPLLLTNTFSVPACATALIKKAILENPTIGRGRRTVNPLVLECNDGRVNDIQAMAVTEAMAMQALQDAANNRCKQGTVGAGTGMRTFGMAGGVGSASRKLIISDQHQYTFGAFVLSNFGQESEFKLMGRQIPAHAQSKGDEPDKGSIIIVFGTDAPLDSRQLSRVARRASAALGKLGSYIGHQSGDIAIAFSNANRGKLGHSHGVQQFERLDENELNLVFHAAVESAEEAVINALWHSNSIEGYDGTRLPTLHERLGSLGLNWPKPI